MSIQGNGESRSFQANGAPARRRGVVLDLIAKRGCDAMLVTDPLNVRYLTGFTGSHGSLCLSPDEARLVTDGRYAEQARREAPDIEIEISTEAPLKVLAGIAHARGYAALAAEMQHLSWAQFRDLADIVDETRLRPQKSLVESVRAVKEEDEIERLRRAEALVDDVFADLLGWMDAGMTEREVAARINYEMQRRGASGVAFTTIVASGPRGSLPHGVASDKRIQSGELVVLDFGAVLDGYASDMTRTVMVGEPSGEERRVYSAVEAAHGAALEAARPGVACRDVDRAAREVLAAHGLDEHFCHSLGHGVGLAVHEDPRLSTKSEETLRPGMVVTIEPGVYLPGWGGVRIEDLVVVREDGPEVLSQSPRELIAVGGGAMRARSGGSSRKDA